MKKRSTDRTLRLVAVRWWSVAVRKKISYLACWTWFSKWEAIIFSNWVSLKFPLQFKSWKFPSMFIFLKLSSDKKLRVRCCYSRFSEFVMTSVVCMVRHNRDCGSFFSRYVAFYRHLVRWFLIGDIFNKFCFFSVLNTSNHDSFILSETDLLLIQDSQKYEKTSNEDK